MIDRFLNWLEQKANDFLVWMYERERRHHETCPDCHGAIGLDCSCAEQDDMYEQMQEAYEAGINEGFERAGRHW